MPTYYDFGGNEMYYFQIKQSDTACRQRCLEIELT